MKKDFSTPVITKSTNRQAGSSMKITYSNSSKLNIIIARSNCLGTYCERLKNPSYIINVSKDTANCRIHRIFCVLHGVLGFPAHNSTMSYNFTTSQFYYREIEYLIH